MENGLNIPVPPVSLLDLWGDAVVKGQSRVGIRDLSE